MQDSTHRYLFQAILGSNHTINKLNARSIGSFRILQRIEPNAYVINIPLRFSTSSTFNIDDLMAYKGPRIPPENPLLDSIEPTSEPILSVHLRYLHSTKLN